MKTQLLTALLLGWSLVQAQVTTIQGTDSISSSRTTINNNFSYLNGLVGATVVQSNPNGNSCTTATALAKLYNGTIYTCQNGTYAAVSGGVTYQNVIPLVQVYNVALTPTEIANIYSVEKSVYASRTPTITLP